MKHTVGKYEHRHCVDGYGVFSRNIMVARVDNTIGEFNEEKANAEFIVTACNNHYELLEALRDIIKVSTAVMNNPHNRCVSDGSSQAINIAKQAIKKAVAK